MKTDNSQRRVRQIRLTVTVIALLSLALATKLDLGMNFAGATSPESIPNNQPVRNPNGKSATFSTQGSVNLTGEYFQAQGTNGRSCVSCHIAEEAWSINPGTLQHLMISSMPGLTTRIQDVLRSRAVRSCSTIQILVGVAVVAATTQLTTERTSTTCYSISVPRRLKHARLTYHSTLSGTRTLA